MIATSTGFWKAFFDPADPNHSEARSDIRIFDREKIVLSEFVIAEVVSWLLENSKTKQKDWFLDYALNTANARIFLFGKEGILGNSENKPGEGPYARESQPGIPPGEAELRHHRLLIIFLLLFSGTRFLIFFSAGE
jgi:hypothetical protein